MNKIKSIIYTLLMFIFIIVFWYFLSLRLPPLFVPNPINVLNDFIYLIFNGRLFIHIWYTFRRILIATCISGVTSLPIGLLIYNNQFARSTVNPLINLLRYIPITAFYPLLILWVGIGEEMKITFYVIATFVYMMPSVVLSLEEINKDLIDTGFTIGMNKLQTITMIQLPAILPSILNSFIMMFGIGWTYCTVVESINAKWGLGYLIEQSSSRANTDLVFLGIITIMLISFVFDNTAKYIVKKVFKWRYINDTVE